MRKNLMLFVLSAVLISCKSETTDLSLRLEKGKEYRQSMISESTIVQDFDGQEMKMEMNISGTMLYVVKEVNTDSYLMDCQFESLEMSMEMPQGSMSVSSASNDPNDIFSSMMKAMTNKNFEVVMSKTGKVIEVRNIEQLWDSTINAFEELPQMQREQMKAQLMNAYGDKALKGNIEMSTAIYPDYAVNLGDTWNVDTTLNSAGMAAKITTEYEFSQLESDYALIKGTSKINTDDNNDTIEAENLAMKFDLSGNMTSEIKVDNTTGWIIEATIKQEIKGDTFIEENPQMPEGMKIGMKLNSTMTVTN